MMEFVVRVQAEVTRNVEPKDAVTVAEVEQTIRYILSQERRIYDGSVPARKMVQLTAIEITEVGVQPA